MTAVHKEKLKGVAQIGTAILAVGGILSALWWNSLSSLGASVNEVRSKEEVHAVNMGKIETRLDNIDENLKEIKELVKRK